MDTVLVTGAAGFIGMHVCKALESVPVNVVGFDNLNSYYDVRLKEARLRQLASGKRFSFERGNLADAKRLLEVFERYQPNVVINLAAQAGVRYSLLNPHAYIESNVVGFANVLENCHRSAIKHLLFASSSSVYGANRKLPYSVKDNVDHPLSLYAATKKSNELLAHAYSHLYQLPVTGLRFFTVYGPWGRPDMAYYAFTQAILLGEPIQVFNQGKMRRDFTYIDDVVRAVVSLISKVPKPDLKWDAFHPEPETSSAPYRIYNLGNNQPVQLLGFIQELEAALGKKAEVVLMPMQAGDVEETHADIEALKREVEFAPSTPLRLGLPEFVRWYREYHRA
ncbi:MAG: NAD-dependent epimerase [Myxococcales bacterium]|nr:NAD-dependent epimerase [Myxococcales bacterium]